MAAKPLVNTVAIVGVGLIGGSLGMAIRKRKLARFVMGVVRRRRTVADSFRKGALHGATFDLKEGVTNADLVILCAPVTTIAEQLRQIGPWLRPGALVTDVASSKALVEAVAKKYLKRNTFVGAHPMAGSAQTGVLHASADLFDRHICYLSHPHPRLTRFWRALGMRVYVLAPDKHDEWIARTSHMPHLLSFALFQASGTKKLGRLGLKASNPSIRDLARLSKSDPKLWADILLSNKQEVLRALAEHEKGIRALRAALQSKSSKSLEAFISKANTMSKRLAPEG
jgi:prephenate dehydrogenase